MNSMMMQKMNQDVIDFIFCPILGVTYKRGFRSEGTNKQH